MIDHIWHDDNDDIMKLYNVLGEHKIMILFQPIVLFADLSQGISTCTVMIKITMAVFGFGAAVAICFRIQALVFLIGGEI